MDSQRTITVRCRKTLIFFLENQVENIRLKPFYNIFVINGHIACLVRGRRLLFLYLPVLPYSVPDGAFPVVVYSSSLHRIACFALDRVTS